MSVFDCNNEDVLKSQGWRPYKDSTLKSMTKDDLIEHIRCLEHNWAGEIKGNNLLSYRLKCFADLLNEKGYPELFSEICNTPEEAFWSRHIKHIKYPFLATFARTREDYWYHSWIEAQKKIRVYKEAIEDIKSYDPYYYDKDLAESFSLNIDYLVENTFQSLKLEDEEHFKDWFNNYFLNKELLDDFEYLSEEEQKNIDKYIQEHSIEPKDNFFDYYKGSENNEEEN